MVVTFLPLTRSIGTWQERTALPSTWTVQAPHRPEPQPNLVPVRFRCSRTTHRSGVSGSASTLTALLLIVNATAGMRCLLVSHPDVDCSNVFGPRPAAASLAGCSALRPTGAAQ